MKAQIWGGGWKPGSVLGVCVTAPGLTSAWRTTIGPRVRLPLRDVVKNLLLWSLKCDDSGYLIINHDFFGVSQRENKKDENMIISVNFYCLTIHAQT